MKITEILYKCDWCKNEQEHHPHPDSGWHGQIVCDKCGRYISQK